MNRRKTRERVDEIREELRALSHKDTFVLDPRIEPLLGEWNRIRAACQHEFENGECVYCDEQEYEKTYKLH